MSINVTNINDSRHLNNCSLLCYNNSAIHLLYSIKEFRDAVYNTYQITNSNKSIHAVVEQYDIQELLFKLKYIFYLLNKRLVEQQSDTKYNVDDTTLYCSRGGSANNFYNEIYYDLIKYTTILDFNNQGICHRESDGHLINIRTNTDITTAFGIDDICSLNSVSVSRASLIYYLNVFSDITKLFFTHKKNFNNNYEFIFSTDSDKTIICRKYLVIKPIKSIDNPPIKTIFKGTTYLLCGLIVGSNIGGQPGGHFWTVLYNYINSKFTEINDLNPNINTNYQFNPNSTPVEYALYVMEDECTYVDNYPITTQLETLSKISNNGLTSEMDRLNYNILKKIIINKIN